VTFGDWGVFGDIERIRRDLDRFSEAVRAGRSLPDDEHPWAPLVDIYEQADTLVLVVDLPGLKRDEIDLTIHNDSLTLEGERNRADSERGIRLERPMGRFRRSFRIGVPIDPAGAQATYRNGVLRVRLPRAAPQGPTRVSVDVK
jgi:HSP20 family protein